ncbi:hypothetical protein O3M35_004274 [Rhynocoris fuscipes]|uniref:Protein anon-73B1 n=1 Tax=Rhynocoris fuscipes TaxID=488301 RepID=A0AAW1CJE9_9HEMI
MTDLEIPVETTTEFLIRVALYIGAIFQLTCILAIIVLPDKNADEPITGKNLDLSDHESWDGTTSIPTRHSQHRIRRQDKKKRK